ncbi:MAG TPA: lytic transglycosylase domain-containing protein [Bacteroidales bacterium]|nr:lytic transglycosylase domain-containing protein [Bacteroidales bacterium]HPS72774.1 lytic transglycosylase domain-containing protein [Bacteroidales bacterium]
MNNKTIKTILFTVACTAVASFFIYAMCDRMGDEQAYRSQFFRDYRIFAPPVPDKADFAGERVPLDRFYVKESLDREIMNTTFMHSSTILMFKRAYRWFPVIEPILKKNGIPDDFKYLCLAESNLANATSPSNAEGFWQFLQATGQKYGLEINEEVDERYNAEKATEAACDYFRSSHALFGNWTLVAASYNRGTNGLSRALDGQKVKSYYDLYLNDETARYVFRILAIKEVYNHPARYGFFLREQDLYRPIPTHKVTVDTAVTDLADLAAKLKVTYRVLREFNPWIQRYNLPNKTRKVYTFILPKPGMTKIDSLPAIPVSDHFYKDTLKVHQLH